MRTNKHLQNLLFNWPAKVLSLVFAVLIYAFIQYSTLDTRVVTIPLAVTLPDDLVAESLVPQKIEVQIKGTENIIYLVDLDAITATIDFSDVHEVGIATRNIVLVYNERVFDNAQITLLAQPSQYRILFKSGDGQ